MLANGAAYNLRLSSPADTEYTAAPVREGTDSGDSGGTGNPTGFRSFRFTDGDGQHTTDGTTWANLYLYSPVDLQFYFSGP